MIFLYITAIAISVLVYIYLKKHSGRFRFVFAAAIFSVLAIFPTIILIIIGDKALPGSMIVTNAFNENAETHKNAH